MSELYAEFGTSFPGVVIDRLSHTCKHQLLFTRVLGNYHQDFMPGSTMNVGIPELEIAARASDVLGVQPSFSNYAIGLPAAVFLVDPRLMITSTRVTS